MRENNRNNKQETETAFAFSMFLLNLLILMVLGSVAWLMYSAISANNQFSVFLRGGFIQ